MTTATRSTMKWIFRRQQQWVKLTGNSSSGNWNDSSVTPAMLAMNAATATATATRRLLSTTTEPTAGTTHFGYQTVPIQEKEQHVKQVFNNVADSYDIMNDLMSSGLHRIWKDYFIQLSNSQHICSVIRSRQQEQQSVAPLKIIDVAGGTGDIAFRFLDSSGYCLTRNNDSSTGSNVQQQSSPIEVTVCDINTEMLRVGQQRAIQKYGPWILECTNNNISTSDPSTLNTATATTTTLQSSPLLQFIEGNAQYMDQFPDNTFDIYTIAFGLRNVTHIEMALQQAYRIIRPGGRFMCLEFSHVPNDYLRTIYDAYSFTIIPTIGEIVVNDRQSYQYLVESIRKFPKQDALQSLIGKVGFQCTKYTNLTGGIVAIHEGWKPI